jgi:hypothetical protein
VQVNPEVVVYVDRRRFDDRAERISAEEAEQEMLDYARRHPKTLRQLARIMGYRLKDTEEEYRAFGQIIPIFALRPRT